MRYWDNDKDRDFDKALDELIREENERELQERYERLAKEWESQEDITAQNEEHTLEIMGAV